MAPVLQFSLVVLIVLVERPKKAHHNAIPNGELTIAAASEGDNVTVAQAQGTKIIAVVATEMCIQLTSSPLLHTSK
jgi:hypothetical protein